MTTWAIIPVKPLHDSKRRLARLLSAEERAGLIHHFLDDLLATLALSPRVDHILVISGDPAVMALAEAYGAELLIEATPVGLNAAVSWGVAHAAAGGATAALVLPADLPFARVADIEQMLRPLTTESRRLVALTGNETGTGTNALLLAPPGDFEFHYGPDSLRAHLDEARARGRPAYLVDAPGLRFDLDTEADWRVYSGELVEMD